MTVGIQTTAVPAATLRSLFRGIRTPGIRDAGHT